MSVFEFGDQDYGSMVGWDPHRERVEKMKEEARKKYPRAFAPDPEMLFVRTAEQCVEMSTRWEPMQQLFGPLWLKEELAVLYSMSGVGKSALAVQIAESLACGTALAPFNVPQPGIEVTPQRVLYIDFELTLPQFSRRYSTESDDGIIENPYHFSSNMLRAELYWDGKIIDGYDDYTDMLFTDIENKLDAHDAYILICDNLTFLSRNSSSSGQVAFRLMNRLQELKKRRLMSILVVAHTPKRDQQLPLTERDLQGSVDITKIADSTFALGQSFLANDLRYIKQIKSRDGRIEYDAENALIYRLAKFDPYHEEHIQDNKPIVDNFFGYSYIGTDDERSHLQPRFRPVDAKRRPKLNERLVKYAKMLAKQGLSTAAIGRRLGISKPTAHRYVGKVGQNARLT